MKWLSGFLILISVWIISSSPMQKENIVYKEKIVTDTIYKNQFANRNVENLNDLYENIINPIEKKFGAVFISSLFRCDKNSQHNSLQAADLDFDLVSGGTNVSLYHYIRDSLCFDQLIIYYSGKHMSHVHVSFSKERNRKEVLRCYRWKGKRWYKRI